jgi:hypothetical protein
MFSDIGTESSNGKYSLPIVFPRCRVTTTAAAPRIVEAAPNDRAMMSLVETVCWHVSPGGTSNPIFRMVVTHSEGY